MLCARKGTVGSNPTLSAEIAEELVAGGAVATEAVPGSEQDAEHAAASPVGGGGGRSGLGGEPPSSLPASSGMLSSSGANHPRFSSAAMRDGLL